MRFEAYVAMRYLRGKRKARFVNVITLISIAGVMVGVMALIVVMSVMTGIDQELTATAIGNRAHLFIKESRSAMADPDKVIADARGLCPEIVAASPVLTVQALIRAEGRKQVERYSGAYVEGIDPERETGVRRLGDSFTNLQGRMYGEGRLPQHLREIALGFLLADKLGVSIGDTVTLITPRGGMGALGQKTTDDVPVTICGIAETQDPEFDMAYSYVTLDTAQLLSPTQGADGVNCRLVDSDPLTADQVKERIERAMGLECVTWYEQQRALFEALKQEKFAMFIVLAFILLVAVFSIASALIMVVMEKRRDIGILRTIGVSSGSIMRVFVLQGLYTGLIGSLLGLVTGILLAYNLTPVTQFLMRVFNVDFGISDSSGNVAVAVVWQDVAWITVSSVVLTVAATLYPAWNAARLDPVNALRND